MLAARNFRKALELLQAGDKSHAWQLRETLQGPYLALEGVPRHSEQAAACLAHLQALSSMDGATPIPDLLDYHICYSHSYQVPIMCFKAMSLDSQPLGLQALQQLFPLWPLDSEQQGWAFVMQQEHPLLPGPCWFSLHPCNTGSVIALALGLAAESTPPSNDAEGKGPEGKLWTTSGLLSPHPPSAPPAAGNGGSVGEGARADTTEAALSEVAGEPMVASASAETIAQHGMDLDSVQYACCRAAGRAGCSATCPITTQSMNETDDSAPEGIPDLDQLCLGLSSRTLETRLQSVEAVGRVQQHGGQLHESERSSERVGSMVGPTGVRWANGEVPLCPADAESLWRYMSVWLSLVAPHVGLRAPKV